MNKYFSIKTGIVALSVIIIDQLTKFFILANPGFHQTGNFFELYLTKNEGIAFSIPLKGTLFYVLLVLLVGCGLYYGRSHLRLGETLTSIVVGLIVGGGIGNIIDRIRFGYVVDFIKLGSWPMFNVADSAITIGVILALIFHRKITIQTPKPS